MENTFKVIISGEGYLDIYELERAVKTGLRYKYGANLDASVDVTTLSNRPASNESNH